MKKTLLIAALAVFALSTTTAYAGGKDKGKEKSKKECAKACAKEEGKPACCAKKTACQKPATEVAPKAN